MSDNTIRAFGASFYTGSRSDVLNFVETHRKDRFTYIVTPNVNHIVRLRSDPDFRRAYDSAAMQLCDSRIVRILLRLVGCWVPVEVIPGSDLTAELIDVANAEGWRVNIIGASEHDMDNVRRKYPNVDFCHLNPPMGFINNKEEVRRCVDFVNCNLSDLTLLAVGSPRQEFLAEKILEDGNSQGVALCIGASVLFVSGGLKRAPVWIQKLCLEGLFRISTEPRRLIGRYFFDGINIVPIVISELVSRVFGSAGKSAK
jgi:N-acetylglucosaminyldiphosphoundecaprenol N-acetyl-beta-D-mannosaminyltransferase